MNDKVYVNIEQMSNRHGVFPIGTEFRKIGTQLYEEIGGHERPIMSSGYKLKLKGVSMNKLESGQFMVGSQHKKTGRISFSETPKIHPTLTSAREEAERLASISNDKNFVVVEVKGVASVANVIWN